MIRLAEDINTLRALCEDSPFGCQIFSAAEAYGSDQPFAMFWTDEHAAYSLLDGVMRLCGTVTDPEEAGAFMAAVGAQRVVCSRENGEALGLIMEEYGPVLRKDVPLVERQWTEPPRLKDVYEVLKSCDMVGDFEPFYLDLSHRLRHGTAAATCCSGDAVSFDGSNLAAEGNVLCKHSSRMLPVAVTVSMFGPDCSLISAVAVHPAYRRQGLGTKILRETEGKLGGRIYLLREEDKNEAFYASMGYEPCGTWCVGRLQQRS